MKSFFLLLTLFIINRANANNYYFSSSIGDDSHTSVQAQNPATPWKSLDKLNSFFKNLQPGDSVLFKRGDVFYGSITVGASGNVYAPIVLSTYGTGEKPVISGFTTLTNWTSVGNGIYQSSCQACKPNVNMLIMNGKPQRLGRYPNTGYLTFESHVSNTSITDNELTGTPNWTGAEVVIRKRHWIIDRNKIISHTGNTITYTTSSPYSGINNFGYFIQNDRKTLDVLGEWHFESVGKNIQVFFGSNIPSSYIVKTSIIDTLVYIPQYYNYLTFDNLSLEGANADAFRIINSQDVLIQNCNINFSGANAITAFAAPFITIDNSHIINANNIGIYLDAGCTHAFIKNNTIRNTGLIIGMGASGDAAYEAVISEGPNSVIEHNIIDSTGYIGIYFKRDSVKVKNNFVNHSCLVKDDGGGIYTYLGNNQSISYGSQIIGNIILNSKGASEGTGESSQAYGIYIDGLTENIDILSNTIANCTSAGISSNAPKSINIKRNTLFNNGTQILLHNRGVGIRNFIIKNNIAVSKTSSQLALTFFTPYNDIKDFGTADSNIYARPFDDEYVFHTYDSGNIYPGNVFNLEGWITTFNKDKNSKKSPFVLPTYTYTLSGVNKFVNGQFTANIKGVDYTNCIVSYDKSNTLDNTCLKVTPAAPPEQSSALQFRVGAVDKAKSYILKYSSLGTKMNKVITICLIQAHYPYSIISTFKYAPLTNNRIEYQLLFTPTLTDNDVQLMFQVKSSDSTVWLDNIEFYEANVKMTNPDNYIRFEYNASTAEKIIPLDGVYMGVDSTIYSNTVTLAPYSSLVLLKNVRSKLLPLQFLNFIGKKTENTIELQWKTANESNTDFFEVLKSSDGAHFSSIGQLASGNGLLKSIYKLIDKKPLVGKNYYQIKQVDKDGKYTYSKIIVINYSETVNLQISPNPATDKIIVSVKGKHPQNATLLIKSITGYILQRISVNLQNENLPVDISMLTSGTYIIGILFGNNILNQKFIKQ